MESSKGAGARRSTEPVPTSYQVGEAEAGQRIDVVVACLAGITRSQARRWIEAERVRLNGAACRPSQRVSLGDTFEATAPETIASTVEPQPIALEVLYEDECLIVIDKPAGMVVHPAPGHPDGTLVNALLYHCRDLGGVGGVMRPGIVHRLDRGTSGVMVAAKSDEAHQSLSAQFRDHSITRVYRALVRGVPSADHGRIDLPIGRHRSDRKRMSVRSMNGRDAHTAWRVLQRFPDLPRAGHSLLEIEPETGRTHQIRVHLSSAGLPIVGDPVYGRAGRGASSGDRSLDRPALHAFVLGFEHPRRGERMRFEVPFPPDIAQVLAALETRDRSR
ncbi:RluA family pseudouridine synthase [Myxococcota bacterium]|nr:RluA family pseudouridine synthase [Myxococcota bacterium]